jgi:hypothetical protein
LKLLADARGSAVVGAVANLALLTLLTVSLVAVVFAGYHLSVLKDIAVSASRQGALAEQEPGAAERYALRLMRESVPLLAAHRAEVATQGGLVRVELTAAVPLMGALPSDLKISARAESSLESLG